MPLLCSSRKHYFGGYSSLESVGYLRLGRKKLGMDLRILDSSTLSGRQSYSPSPLAPGRSKRRWRRPGQPFPAGRPAAPRSARRCCGGWPTCWRGPWRSSPRRNLKTKVSPAGPGQSRPSGLSVFPTRSREQPRLERSWLLGTAPCKVQCIAQRAIPTRIPVCHMISCL